jgi:hypothetical protein
MSIHTRTGVHVRVFIAPRGYSFRRRKRSMSANFPVHRFSRRQFLRTASFAAGGLLITACAAPQPAPTACSHSTAGTNCRATTREGNRHHGALQPRWYHRCRSRADCGVQEDPSGHHIQGDVDRRRAETRHRSQHSDQSRSPELILPELRFRAYRPIGSCQRPCAA